MALRISIIQGFFLVDEILCDRRRHIIRKLHFGKRKSTKEARSKVDTFSCSNEKRIPESLSNQRELELVWISKTNRVRHCTERKFLRISLNYKPRRRHRFTQVLMYIQSKFHTHVCLLKKFKGKLIHRVWTEKKRMKIGTLSWLTSLQKVGREKGVWALTEKQKKKFKLKLKQNKI